VRSSGRSSALDASLWTSSSAGFGAGLPTRTMAERKPSIAAPPISEEVPDLELVFRTSSLPPYLCPQGLLPWILLWAYYALG